MSLTLADLQVWDPEQISEVAEAAAARARTSREAAKELLNLSTFPSCGGRSAETAQGALTKTHTKIDLSASDAFRVSIGAATPIRKRWRSNKSLPPSSPKQTSSRRSASTPPPIPSSHRIQAIWTATRQKRCRPKLLTCRIV